MKSELRLLAMALCMALVCGLAGCGGPSKESSAPSEGGTAGSKQGSLPTGDDAPLPTDESGNEIVPTDASGNPVTGASTPSGGGNGGSTTVRGPADSTGKGSGNASTGGPTSSSGPVELVIWDDEKNEALVMAAVDYEAKNKNVSVKIKHKPWASLNDLKMAIASKTAPDIVNMDAVYVGAAGSQGYLQDLSPYNAASLKSKFVDICFESVTYNNKIYGLPFDANTVSLVYNKDMFSRAGATVPKNYGELVAACTKIKAAYSEPYYVYSVPFDMTGTKNWNSFIFFTYLWRMGGEILSADRKSAAFNSAAGVEALQMIINMKNDGLIASTSRSDEFHAGRVGMLDTGCFVFDNLFGSSKKANFGVALMPVLKTGVAPYSGLGLHACGLTTGSKNSQEAYKFMEFYCSSTKYQLQYCKKYSYIPSLKEGHSDSFYQKDEWKVMIEQLKYCKYRPSVPNWDKIESSIADALIVAMRGQSSPKEALDAAAKNVNKQL